MGHPDIQNKTPFSFEALFVADESSRPVVTPIIKATYDIGEDGELTFAEEQRPVDFVGESYGEPGESSFKFEPETAFIKPSTDVVLIGHAWAPNKRCTEIDVRFQVGPLQKAVRVTGDRHWEKAMFGARISEPKNFEKIPLMWELAFGGWDTSLDDADKHDMEKRNPLGVGFRVKGAKLIEGSPLPNIEDPGALLTKYNGKSNPAGFGFVCPNWEPRASLAGTYDEAWQESRSPLLPDDFRREFFNAAAEGLIAPAYLEGNEAVTVTHATSNGRLRFALPGLEPPDCLVSRHRADDELLHCNLDTVVVDTDEMQLLLIWRNTLTLRDGPLDVRAMEISCSNAPEIQIEEPDRGNVVPLFPEADSVSPRGI